LVSLLYSQLKGTLRRSGAVFCDENGNGFAAHVVNELSKSLREQFQADTVTVVKNGTDAFKEYKQDENKLHAFIQFIPPPISIFIVGAGNDAIPLTFITSLLG
jgi:radical SAM superfamily enzyme